MLGDTLREAREKQGLTYKDIEKGTSIRALYIEYIEKGEYDELPGDVYTKGFIRSYANFLKLDANALVQAFTAERHKGAAPAAEQKPAAPKAAQEKPQAKKPEAPSVQPAAKPVEKVEKAAKAEKVEKPAEQPAAPKQEAAARKAPVQPKATAVKPQPKKAPASKPAAPRFTAQDFNEPKRSNGKLIAIVAIVLVVLAGAVYALSGSDDSAKKPAAQQQTQQVEAPAPKTYDGVEVTATFTADCWLEVKADGKTVYEGTLKKGDSQTWKGTDKVTVRVGDAGAVSFSVNGKDLGTAGKTGQVANKTFTKDGN